METAGTTQLAGLGAATDAEGQAIGEKAPEQDTSLEVAGFAGAVAQAYASYEYV